VFRGTADLDSNGQASVDLAAAVDPVGAVVTYQLTAVGAPGPSLHVAEEIRNGQFSIAGGQPGAKVSWHITITRHPAEGVAARR
jgi:hypothetical protein